MNEDEDKNESEVSDDIEVSIGPEMAKLLDGLSPEDRAKMQEILGLLVGKMGEIEIPALGKLMDTISDNAQVNGLTPEILEELLADDAQ